ncbi:MAG: DPP IV N-terminal domain-containing protein [Alcanivoracaceae bacterium]|nr:DPP IV N-terminal domain-containing protein [Alcanivoracaceae bacterium]
MLKCGLYKLITVLLLALIVCQNILANDENHINHINHINHVFDLDTLYSNPSIIGTTPQAVVWSQDAESVVFLWNEEGYTFRDVWMYSLKTGLKKRLTKYANKTPTEQRHAGISEVIWLDSEKTHIAYVLDAELFVQGLDGSSQQIEMDKGAIRGLTLSPNGQHLAFIADGALWLRTSEISVHGSARQLLTRGQSKKAYIESYEWSNDSHSLVFKLTDDSFLPERDIHYYAHSAVQNSHVSRAFPGDETARFSIGVIQLDSGNVQFFARPDDKHYIWNYGLSSDAQTLFINSSDLLVKEHIIYVYDVKSAARTVFYREYDASHLRPDWQVAWAPNDEGLIILTDKDGYLHLYHKKTADSKPKALTSGKWEISYFKVDYLHGQIYFLANKSHLSERQIYRVSMQGGKIERISSSKPGTHQPLLSPDMNHATTLFSNDSTPLELYMIKLANKDTEAVTHSPQASFDQLTWANTIYIEFNSHVDGAMLIGRLSLPENYDASRAYPLIVGSVYSDSVRNQYGGRNYHPTWGLDQYFIAQGYIVLNVNVRGSWGQGRLHNQGLRYSYGGIDIEDLHSGVKYLVEQGYVDAKRVGIWGSSYGGLMTMMSLFKNRGSMLRVLLERLQLMWHMPILGKCG